ncbi:MAG: FecR domain-containing protein [Ginsengibacter sp.]
MDNKKNIQRLFQRFLENKCSPEEIRTLLQYFNDGENEKFLKGLIHDQPVDSTFSDAATPITDAVFGKIKNAIASDLKKNQLRVIPFYRRSWFRLSAAAVLLFMIFSSAFYFYNHKSEKVIAQKRTNISAKDIQPGTNNAVLTLDDGTTIMLDSAANGTLAHQGNTKVQKINGEISYNKTGAGGKNSKPVYNTITTANGNEYQLILADGSKVWLNAASSIRFPAFFTGNERKVEITGEAYFEVAHDASKPFRVDFKDKEGRDGEIEVLGTHFNVNDYSDEENVKTTLLEGSVKISRMNQQQMLSPGEQAVLNSNSISFKKNVDVSQVVAWKDGFFAFNNTDLQTIMRQVARWYNVDVNFEGKLSGEGYSGRISRAVPLSKFLKVLELNGLNVRTEGRKVTVIP